LFVVDGAPDVLQRFTGHKKISHIATWRLYGNSVWVFYF
jgi:hypothetical protein